jgi:hypothetical protein
MTDKDYAHYVLIIDHSGSMENMKEDTEGGIKAFITEQASLPGKATLSLYQFDTIHDRVHDFADIRSVPDYHLLPRGGTALNDACMRAVTETGDRLRLLAEDERPGKVIVVIATDGKENSSAEFPGTAGKAKVKEVITRQHDEYGWEFTYIGANVDAFAEAASYGIAAASAMDYDADLSGAAWKMSSGASARYAGGQSASVSYTDTERAAAKKKKE